MRIGQRGGVCIGRAHRVLLLLVLLLLLLLLLLVLVLLLLLVLLALLLALLLVLLALLRGARGTRWILLPTFGLPGPNAQLGVLGGILVWVTGHDGARGDATLTSWERGGARRAARLDHRCSRARLRRSGRVRTAGRRAGPERALRTAWIARQAAGLALGIGSSLWPASLLLGRWCLTPSLTWRARSKVQGQEPPSRGRETTGRIYSSRYVGPARAPPAVALPTGSPGAALMTVGL